MFRRSFLASIAVAISLCTLSLSVADAGERTLTIFAAASMKGSLDKVSALYERKSGVKVAISFAASSALAKQIEAAAPADLFVSADTKWMDYLVDKGLVHKAEVVNLLGNRLVLVAAAQSTIDLKIEKDFDIAAALGDSRLAMGEVRSVPAGKYGRQALEFYGVWKDVEARIAGAENVRAALQLVTRGEAPLGIVYETDARAEKGVRIVDTFADDSHAPIIYPVAPVAASTKPEAKDFLSFLAGAEAQAVFRQAGFTVLAGS